MTGPGPTTRRPAPPAAYGELWPAEDGASPGPTFEEMIRPYGVGGGLSFRAVGRPADAVGYDGLAHRAEVAAARLHEQGMRPGDRVALTITTSLDAVVAALGIWIAGGTVVSVPPPGRGDPDWYRARFGQVLAAMGCRLVLTGGDPAAVPPGGRAIPLAALQGTERVRVRDVPVPDEALVQFTSGSLDAPKGVAISRDRLLGHLRVISWCYDMDPGEDRIATWLPFYHDLGFVCFFLAGLYARVPQVHTDPRTFVLRPGSWLAMLSAERATISGAPNFAYRMAARVPYPDDLDLSRMRSCMNAAERVRWEDVVDFHGAAERFGLSWNALMPAYGMAEGTVGVSTVKPGAGPKRGPDGHVSLGGPMPGNTVVPTRPGTEPSRLRLRSRWLFDGYHTEDGFRRRNGEDFDTGDSGFVHEGEVYVLGREADVVSVAGHNVFAEDVESVALRAGRPVVAACAAFRPTPDGSRFGLIMESVDRDRSAAGELGRAVRSAVVRALGTRPEPVLVVRPGTIPRTTSGKVRRGLCRQTYLDGAIPARRVLAELA